MTKIEMAAAIEALQRSVVRLQADVERLKNPWTRDNMWGQGCSYWTLVDPSKAEILK